jgi:hypothetical protein
VTALSIAHRSQPCPLWLHRCQPCATLIDPSLCGDYRPTLQILRANDEILFAHLNSSLRPPLLPDLCAVPSL